MGSYLSRDVDRVESISDQPASSHTFPPASGPYFAPYYYMGGQKFETSQPESYLFGENSDLQYLGPNAQNFSYKMPATDQLVQALKCLVNIRKDSLRLIRAPNVVNKPDDVISTNESTINDENTPPQKLYNLEFTFDADCPCSIKVFYNASEKLINNSKVVYTPKSDKECSDLVHFNAGSNQQFCLPTHIINPANLQKVSSASTTTAAGKWSFDCIPVVIQVSADAGPAFDGHCHIVYATLEQAPDEGWTIKLTKQKQMIDGVCYIIQEIYGIENKVKSKKEDEEGGDGGKVSDGNWDSDDGADNTECVVCLSDMKDTIILPCKHLCLCNACANQIRFQQSGCPICRQSFRALLQIRAVRKITSGSPSNAEGRTRDAGLAAGDEDEASSSDENNLGISLPPLPEGYEAVPLIDAINGPASHSTLASIPLPATGNPRAATSSSRSRTSSQHRSSRRKKKSSTMIEIEDETSAAQHVLSNVSNIAGSELRRSSLHQSSKKKRSKRNTSSSSNNKPSTNLELQTPVADVSKSYETADEYEVGKDTDPEMASIETTTTRTSGDDDSIEMKPTNSEDQQQPKQTAEEEEANKKEQ